MRIPSREGFWVTVSCAGFDCSTIPGTPRGAPAQSPERELCYWLYSTRLNSPGVIWGH